MYNRVIRITIAASITNIILSSLKIFFGIIGNSQGLLADGFHSLSDLLSDFVVYFGVIVGNKPKDFNHNYGHKKIENLSEILLGLILIISALYIAYDSGIAIYHHREVKPEFITIIIALISVIAKEVLFHFTIKVGKEENNSIIIANAWHQRSDSFSSIAVLIGLVVGYIHEPLHIVDSYMGIIVSFLILKVGISVIWKSAIKLIDTAPPLEIRKQIINIIKQNEEVLNFHNIRMRYIGNEIFIEMHIMVQSDYSIKKAHDISEELKEDIKTNIDNIYDVTIHIEPFEDINITSSK